MTAPLTFSVVYDKCAIRSMRARYLLRCLLTENTWSSYVLMFAAVCSLGLLFFARSLDFLTGLFTGLVAAAILYIFVVVWMYRRADGKTYAAVKEDEKWDFTLLEETIEARWAEGSARFAWTRLRQIWKFDRVWLLMISVNYYFTLPLAGVPAEALQFIDAKIKPRPFGAD